VLIAGDKTRLTYCHLLVGTLAGEELLGESAETDASGNKKLPKIGEFLKKAVEDHFIKCGETATGTRVRIFSTMLCETTHTYYLHRLPLSVKYIDPSYIVRCVPANAADSLYCMQLAQNAVHGAMAGFTGFSVGLCNNRMVWLPIPEMVKTSPRHMDPRGRTWERVLCLTRQPNTVRPLQPGEKSAHSYAPMLR
jgi:6-phosphofructokinase 1